MTDNVIYDLLVILAAGLIAGVVCKRLHVPVLIGYILVGVLIGAGGLGLIRETSDDIGQLAEAGVFLLLFAIGLEFSLDELLGLTSPNVLKAFRQAKNKVKTPGSSAVTTAVPELTRTITVTSTLTKSSTLGSLLAFTHGGTPALWQFFRQLGRPR